MSVPFTEIRTSHAISIRAGRETIGKIQSWGTSQGRDVRLKFEINAVGTGAPIEAVPGLITSQSITVSRLDLYVGKMEEVWGTPKPLWALTDQHNPIEIEEKWITFNKKSKAWIPGLEKYSATALVDRMISPSVQRRLGVGTAAELDGIQVASPPDEYEVSVEKFLYMGCWFTSLGRTMSAVDGRLVQANATLVYTKIRKLL